MGFVENERGIRRQGVWRIEFLFGEFPHPIRGNKDHSRPSPVLQNHAKRHPGGGTHHRTHVDEFQLYREGEGFYQYTDDDYLVLGDDTAGVYRVDGVTQIDSLTGRTIIWYRALNNHISHTTGGRALLRLSSKLGQTFASVDSRREFIKSNLLGVDSLGDDEGVYVRGDVRLNTDVSIGHCAELGSIALSATAAWNINSMFGSRFVPGVELSVDMADDGSSILFVCEPFCKTPLLHQPVLHHWRSRGQPRLAA